MALVLNDANAKDRLRQGWPANTRAWSGEGEEWWLRAQPKDGPSAPTGPRLMAPGSKLFATQPDGLWITLGIPRGDTASRAEHIDCIAIEASRSRQNLADKRSRYAASTTSLVVDLPLKWLDKLISVQGQGNVQRTRRELLGGNLATTGAVRLPVRHLRVLYALPNNGQQSLFKSVKRSVPLGAHEFLCTHGLLGSWPRISSSGLFQRMAPSSHHWS